MTFRGELSTVHAGETANIPANASHNFVNNSGGTVRLLCVVSPAGLEEFFSAVGDPVATSTSPPPELNKDEQDARAERATELAPRYRQQILPPDGRPRTSISGERQ